MDKEQRTQGPNRGTLHYVSGKYTIQTPVKTSRIMRPWDIIIDGRIQIILADESDSKPTGRSS